MAEVIRDKLYQVAIGGRWQYSFIHAKNEEELIRFLAENYPNKDEIYGATEILRDGTTRTAKIISHPLFDELYAHNEEKDAAQLLPAGVTMIRNRPWGVMLSTGGLHPGSPCLWDDFMSVTGGNNRISHHQNVASWCQESSSSGLQVQRGGFVEDNEQGRLVPSSTRSSQIGYRPVLVPLDPETLEHRASYFLGRENGEMFCMGSLYMDDLPQHNPQEPTQNGDIPSYVPGAKLRIGDSSPDLEHRITWVKVGDVLISDRNLMNNISFDDLDRMGLARGPDHLQYGKVSLDRLMEKAQKRVAAEKGYHQRPEESAEKKTMVK